MGTIYQRAVLTIIAANGENAEASLPFSESAGIDERHFPAHQS